MIWCAAMNFLAFLDGMWFLATRPMITVPKFFAEFSPSERTAGVFSRSVTVTNKFKRTKTRASSFASTSLLAVITMVGFFDILKVSNSALLRSILLTMCKACSGVHHKLSFLRLYCGCGRQHPLIGRRTECSFFSFFELFQISWQVLHASPRAHRPHLAVSPGNLSSNFTAQGLS